MTLLEVAVLAVLQGLTEFLPISSSGHLVLAGSLFGIRPQESLQLIVILHIATAFAALAFYRREIGDLAKGLLAGSAEARRLLLMLAIATVVTAVIGLKFRGFFTGLFEAPHVVPVSLFVTGAILMAATRRSTDRDGLVRLAWWKAALLGLAQGIAIIPGLSRSGTTIAAGLFLGLRREEAVRFSFFLLIPATAGAALLEGVGTASPGEGDLLQLLTGFLIAALVGYTSILLVLRWIRSGRLWYFGIYCWCAALLAAFAEWS